MIYLFIFVFFLILALWYDREVDNLTESSKRHADCFFLTELVVLILLAGLRNGVGGDTFSYIAYWKSDFYKPMSSLNLETLDLLNRFGIGWMFLSTLVKSFTSEFFVFQLVHAVIINSVMFYFIDRLTKYRFTVVIFYFITSYLYFNLEIMRQSLANVFFLLSLFYFVRKQWVQYLALVFVSLLFHNSSVFFFILPLFYKVLTSKVNVKFVAIALACGVVLKLLMPFLHFDNSIGRGIDYYSEMSRSSFLGDIHVWVNVLLLYFLAGYISDEEDVCDVMKCGMNFYFYCSLFGLFLPIFDTRYATIVLIVLYMALIHLLVQRRFNMVALLVFLDSIVFTYKHQMSSWGGNSTQVQKYHFYNLYFPYYSIFDENVENQEYYRYRYHSMHRYD